MTMRKAEIQVTKRRYPCGAVAGGPSPLPYQCPEHGVDCLVARLLELEARVVRATALVARWRQADRASEIWSDFGVCANALEGVLTDTGEAIADEPRKPNV